jgi:hypothetical protein
VAGKPGRQLTVRVQAWLEVPAVLAADTVTGYWPSLKR